MKGLTPRQLLEITEFVQKHHRFGYVHLENRYEGHDGYSIKYIDACYDSRQGDYWAVSFRGLGLIRFTTNAFVMAEKPAEFTYTSLYDWIMAFLKYEWTHEDPKYSFMWAEREGPLHNSFPNGEIETEWSDIDMMAAYCADLEGGANSQDTADAAKWVSDYRVKKNHI